MHISERWQYGWLGVRTLIWCATLGVGAELLLWFALAPRFASQLLNNAPTPFLASLATFLVVGTLCGLAVGGRFYRDGDKRHWAVGIIAAWSLALASVLAGLITNFIAALNSSHSAEATFGEYIIHPLLFWLLFNALPITIVGGIYTETMRRATRKRRGEPPAAGLSSEEASTFGRE